MKPDWNRRFAAGLLAILLCLCSFSMPAFASGSDPAPEPLPEIIEEEPTTGGMEPEGVPITPKGNATLTLHQFFTLVATLHTHIFVFDLVDFSVSKQQCFR